MLFDFEVSSVSVSEESEISELSGSVSLSGITVVSSVSVYMEAVVPFSICGTRLSLDTTASLCLVSAVVETVVSSVVVVITSVTDGSVVVSVVGTVVSDVSLSVEMLFWERIASQSICFA